MQIFAEFQELTSITVFLDEQRIEMGNTSAGRWSSVEFHYKSFFRFTIFDEHILGAPPAFYMKMNLT